MVVILFAVNTGFQLFSHICFMGGGQEVSPTEIASCCAHEPVIAAHTLSSSCCDDDTQFIKMDLTTLVSVYQGHPILFSVIVADMIQHQVATGDDNLAFVFDQYPPPKPGRDILSLNQVFRI